MVKKNMMKLPGQSQAPRFLQRINWVFNPVQLMEKSAQAYGDFFTLNLSSQEPFYLPILGTNLKYVPPKPSTMLRVFASIIF